MTQSHVLILQHVPWEKPGRILDSLDDLGMSYEVMNIAKEKKPDLPDSSDVSGIVIMGGPMGALDTDKYPGLKAESKLVRAAVSVGKPLLGVCLGHQIISLAYGAKTYKLKFGHRGGNHPVKNLKTNKIEITSQNHSYAVNADSLLETPLSVTHINLLDQTVEGVVCERDRVFSVQYHPESAPGPQDSTYLFDQFITLIKEGCQHAEKNRS